MNLKDLRTNIEKYKPYNEQEEKDKQIMLKYIDTFDNIIISINLGLGLEDIVMAKQT